MKYKYPVLLQTLQNPMTYLQESNDVCDYESVDVRQFLDYGGSEVWLFAVFHTFLVCLVRDDGVVQLPVTEGC